MLINSLKGIQFKNYSSIGLELSPRCNVIFGLNGTGKTNLLDLIHFICLGKSYFSIGDKQAIKNTKDFLRVEGALISQNEEKSQMAVSIPASGRKKIWYNGNVLKKNTDILGLVPLVCIVPDDIDIVKGSSIVRRKFMDRILCQLSPIYTHALINYDRALKQKLALMKNSQSISELDLTLLRTYDEMLFTHGKEICQSRKRFCMDFSPSFEKMYGEIAEDKELATIFYQTNFNEETFLKESEDNRHVDFYSKRVRKGVHRDDVLFEVNDKNVRKFASQGQIKTFIYALKFSEYTFLSNKSDRKPILLMDDIFEKLDESRLQKLFQLMTSSQFGQIFITDTEKKRSVEILIKLKIDHRTFEVKDNSIIPENG